MTATTTATRKAFQVRGMTDQITQCELCGRDELRGTVQLLELDADGTPFADHYYGTSCAAKAAGWTQREVKDRIKAAEQARRDAEQARRDAERAAFADFKREWLITNYGTTDMWEAAKKAGTSAPRLSSIPLDLWNKARQQADTKEPAAAHADTEEPATVTTAPAPDPSTDPTADADAVFTAAARATHWTRTNLGPTTEITHNGGTWTIELPNTGHGRARITGRYGYGGTTHLDTPATWAQTAAITEAAVGALRLN